MKKKILFLRISYWWGIIADAVMFFLMLFPERFAVFFNTNTTLDANFAYGLRLGAPLMAGWTVLLIWADRRPLERRDILLITMLPVAGLILFEIYSVNTGFSTISSALRTFLLQITMSGMMLFSYLYAGYHQPEPGSNSIEK